MRAPLPRKIGQIAVIIMLVIVVVGPWPSIDAPYTGMAYFRDTVAQLSVSPGKCRVGPLRAGVAQVDLALPTPVPLAGFIDQIMQPHVGVSSACSAKALTIAGDASSVTILAADLLLIDDRLARAVLSRTGLPRDQIYFTATHTHSGPGGWGLHPLERLVAGSFRPAVFNHLADRLAEVVLRSRDQPRPVEVAFTQVRLGDLQKNRIVPGGATNDLLSAWIFHPAGAPAGQPALATFATFGAHATIAHPTPPRLGGDYPAAFAAALPALVDSGVVLFAAGSVGDASPVRPPAANSQKSVEAYGQALATALAAQFATAPFGADVPFGNLGLDVELPPVQIPCRWASLRFSPWFTWWVGGRHTYLHAVRLGPAVLVGFPGDYAGDLASQLATHTTPVVPTSFNGEYKGYLVSKAIFDLYPSYETRLMNFFGPESGDYLNDLARRCRDRLLMPGP